MHSARSRAKKRQSCGTASNIPDTPDYITTSPGRLFTCFLDFLSCLLKHVIVAFSFTAANITIFFETRATYVVNDASLICKNGIVAHRDMKFLR